MIFIFNFPVIAFSQSALSRRPLRMGPRAGDSLVSRSLVWIHCCSFFSLTFFFYVTGSSKSKRLALQAMFLSLNFCVPHMSTLLSHHMKKAYIEKYKLSCDWLLYYRSNNENIIRKLSMSLTPLKYIFYINVPDVLPRYHFISSLISFQHETFALFVGSKLLLEDEKRSTK